MVDWQTVNGFEFAPDSAGAERDDFEVVILEGRLRDTLQRLNPEVGYDALDDAFPEVDGSAGDVFGG